MKAIKRADGYKLQVGDIVIIKHAFGQNRHVIERLTKTTAISGNNNFPLEYGSRFSYKPRHTWDNNDYDVYTPVDL